MIKILCIEFIIIILIISKLVFSTTIRVPNDQATIQEGINVSNSGDTVLVADGIYMGNRNRDIDFVGKNIVLISENGPDNTIIDCEGDSLTPHRAFYFHFGEDTSAVIDGFTIKNGYAPGEDPYDYSYGGAIYCDSSYPSLNNIVFQNNYSTFGGAIYAQKCSLLVITNCKYFGNAANSQGSSLYVIDDITDRYSLILQGCLFANNSSLGGAGGNVFSQRVASIINSCTFSGDSTSSSIYLSYGTTDILNTIIYGNILGQAIDCAGGSITINCSDIYGNTGGNWTDCVNDFGTINGNFSLDPYFCDVSINNYHIETSSLCAPDNNSCGELIGAMGVGCELLDIYGTPEDEPLPYVYSLEQNFPNPFNPSTTIEYNIKSRTNVQLAIFNLLGQKIRTLIDDNQQTGKYAIEWDGADDTGQPVASGIYFYQLKTVNLFESRKMILLK